MRWSTGRGRRAVTHTGTVVESEMRWSVVQLDSGPVVSVRTRRLELAPVDAEAAAAQRREALDAYWRQIRLADQARFDAVGLPWYALDTQDAEPLTQ